MSNDKELFDQSMQLDGADPRVAEIEARRLATYSVEALRIGKEVDKIFVLFPGVTTCLGALDRQFQLGTEFEMSHGMCLVGSSGVGKSAVFNYFRESLPRSALFAKSNAAIDIRLQGRPRTGQIVQRILNAFRYPFSSGTYKQLYLRRAVVFDVLKEHRTRLLWIDEAQHLMRVSRKGIVPDSETDATEFLRELIDECKVSLILAGTQELDRLPELAPHLASRIAGRETLENFKSDAMWVGFVRSFAKQCHSFDLGYLHDTKVATRLHMACDGNLRAFKRLVTEAVLFAYDEGTQTIDKSVMANAFRLVYGTASNRSNPFV